MRPSDNSVTPLACPFMLLFFIDCVNAARTSVGAAAAVVLSLFPGLLWHTLTKPDICQFECQRRSKTAQNGYLARSQEYGTSQETVVLRPGTYAYGPAKRPREGKCTSSVPCILFIAF